MLKKKVGDKPIMPTLPLVGADNQIKIAPELVLKRRAIMRNNQPVSHVLIQWVNLEPKEATREDIGGAWLESLELKK